jgi:DNA repair exonuclease SbcCD ATPase subunit
VPNARLKSLTLGPFQSFKKPATIEFPETGLFLLHGRNKNTGGGSGAGKSSVLRALSYVEDICDTPATELQTWGVKEPATASATYSCDDGLLSVSKGKSYDVKLNGKALDGSAKQKSAEVLKRIGGPRVTREMLQILTYRGQGKPGLFLNQTNVEKQEFLTQILDLAKFEEAIEKATTNVSAYEKDVDKARAEHGAYASALAELLNGSDMDSLRSGLDRLHAELEELQGLKQMRSDTLASLKSQIRAIAEKACVDAKAAEAVFADDVAAANAKLVELQNTEIVPQPNPEITRFNDLVAECQGRIDRLLAQDRAKQEETRKKLAELQKLMDRARVDVALGQQAEKNLKDLNREFDQLTASVCPTCERLWDEAHLKKAKLIKDIEAAHKVVDAGTKAASAIEQLNAEMAPLRAPFVANPTIEKLRVAQADAQSRVAAVRQQEQADLSLRDAQLQAEIARATQAYTEVRTRAKAASATVLEAARVEANQLEEVASAVNIELQQGETRRTELSVTFARLEAKIAQVEKLQQQVDAAAAKVGEQEKKLTTEKDFLGLIGREGFLGAIFDEVLAEISDETNQILASVANTRHCTLRFVSEKITGKGSIKKEIRPVVTVHGYETSLNAGLSGGMRSAVELAVDLAVGAVISRRSGCCPGWLILDESFDGLGPVEKESCLEILQVYARDRLVIVVDHMSETQGLFTQKVVVDYEGSESTLAAS